MVAGAIGVYALATLARGWRWHRILFHSQIDHQRADAYGLVVVGYMGNTVLPLRGGELLRVVLLGQRSNSTRREILGSIIGERLLDAVALALLFGALTLLSLTEAPGGETPAWLALGALGLGAAAIGAYRVLRTRGRLTSFSERMKPFTRATKTLLTAWGAAMLALTLVVWSLEGVVFWLVGQSLQLPIGVIDGIGLVVLASFFAMLPAAPGYVGTYDAAIALGLKGLDVPGSAAVGFTLLARFVVYVPITLVGLLLLIVRYRGLGELNLGRLRRENRELAERDREAPDSVEVPVP